MPMAAVYKPPQAQPVINSRLQHQNTMAEMYTTYRLNWHILLFVMATVLTSTFGALTRTCYPDDMEKRGHHLCGKALSQTLALICVHGYNNQKRSIADTVPAAVNSWEVEPVQGRSPFMDKRLALSVLQNRGKRGTIVCECCKHRCSYPELREYCKLPDKRAALSPAVPKNSQDQVTSNTIDDVTWGLDDASARLTGTADDDMDTQTGYSAPLNRDDADLRADSHIGRLVRLLLEKSSIIDSKN